MKSVNRRLVCLPGSGFLHWILILPPPLPHQRLTSPPPFSLPVATVLWEYAFKDVPFYILTKNQWIMGKAVEGERKNEKLFQLAQYRFFKRANYLSTIYLS